VIGSEGGMAAKATIWHNPKCGTSRKVLDALRAKGLEPEVIEYLKTPPSRAKLQALLKARARCCAARARPMTSAASTTRSSRTTR
jgi:arsenate reductase-like glutaredoxin family protein